MLAASFCPPRCSLLDLSEPKWKWEFGRRLHRHLRLLKPYSTPIRPYPSSSATMAASAFAFYPHFSPSNPVARSKSRRTPIPFPGHRASYVAGRCTGIRAQCTLQAGRFSLDVASEMQLKARGFMGMRKTKLVCTIGPACCSEEQLETLAMGGMNIARLNMCHNTREWHRNAIQAIRRLNEEKGFCISVLIDTAGSDFPMLDHGSTSSIKTEVFVL